MTDLVLPDTAHDNDPGHSADHNLIVSAIQALNLDVPVQVARKAPLIHKHLTPDVYTTRLPVPLLGVSVGGLGANLSTQRWTTLSNILGADGQGIIRVDAAWDGVESVQGTYNWGLLDSIVASAVSAGIRLHFMVGYSPTWANGGATDKLIPDAGHVANWQAYCQALAARYIPYGVVSYEVWNEPNIPAFVTSVDAALFTTRVLQPAYTGLKAAATAANVDITVVAPGLSPAATGGGSVSPFDFYTTMYANGAKGYFDAAALHPYITPNLDPNYIDGGRTNTLTVAWDVWGVMKANGDSSKTIWATEFGWPNKTGGSGSTTTPTLAQGYLQTWLARWFGCPFSGPAFVYQDTDAGVDGSVENSFGLVANDGTPKSPYYDEYVSQVRKYARRGKVTPAGTWVDAVKALSPIAWWRLGENWRTATTGVSQVGSYTITKTGTILPSPGRTNDGDGATSFDGSTGYLTAASTNALNMNGAHSVAFWHTNVTDVGSFPKVMGVSGVWNIYFHVANQQFAYSRDGKEHQTQAPSVSYSEPVFLVFVSDGSTGVKWYVNGVLNKVTTLPSVFATNTTAGIPYIGADSAGTNKGNQIVDDVVFFASALKDEDVWAMWVGAKRPPGV